MIKKLRTFMTYFGQGYGRSIVLIILGGVIIGIFETMGILLIFPLMGLVVSPAETISGGTIGRIHELIGSPSIKVFIAVFSVCVGSVYVVKALFQIGFTKWQHRLLAQWKISICYRFFCKFLDADYGYHVQRNSSKTISLITTTVDVVLNNFMYQVISLTTQIITAIILCLFMLIYQPLITVVVALFFFLLFQIQNSFVKKRVRQAGGLVDRFKAENVFAMQQALGAYKETKINLKEKYFQRMFLNANRKLMETESNLLFFQTVPISTTEIIVLFVIIIAFNMITAAGQSAQAITQSLAVIVVTMFRLIPIVNRSLTSVSFINSATIPLDMLVREADAVGYRARPDTGIDEGEPPAMALESSLSLKNVHYTYPEASHPALHEINLTIRKGEFVGIIGPSGAGKTTLVAILLGFLKAETGDYIVDGEHIDDHRIRSLRHSIGYVDQQPFIFDATVMENIAFGVEKAEIDRDRVEQALRQTMLWDMVSGLEKGMESSVGENGRRFSGGERQRLAIARALYKQPTLLILDEATSALDVDTEQRLSETILRLKGSLTIIVIAHRLSTLQACDRLIMMKEGRIVDDGSYEELMERNATFRRLVDASRLRGPGKKRDRKVTLDAFLDGDSGPGGQ